MVIYMVALILGDLATRQSQLFYHTLHVLNRNIRYFLDSFI